MSDEVSNINKKGYTVKVKKNSVQSNLKLPIFCPVETCRKISSNLDDIYFETFGFCSECFILHVENRVVPTIDVQFYKDRLRSRGY